MKYLITLRPLDNYFFGGEVTLGEGSGQNFFVTSNNLPQSSSLVGLMRYEVLRQHNLLSYNPSDPDTLNKVKRLIGERGFDLENPASAYGIIQSISPLFLCDKEHYYTPMPLDNNVKKEETDGEEQLRVEPIPVRTRKDNVRCSYAGTGEVSCKAIPEAETFDAKTYNAYMYWCDEAGNPMKVEPFSKVQQIGILKNKQGETEEKALFKQTLIKLHESLKMVFSVETSEPLTPGSCITPLGGNRSMFYMEIEEKEMDWSQCFQELHRDGRLLALGDARLTDDERKACTFIWGMCTDMRHISNNVNEKHSWSSPKKSQLHHLQGRGSVVYADAEQLKAIRNAHPDLQKAGLNLFI